MPTLRVTDERGAPVQGAQVSVNPGFAFPAQTDANGTTRLLTLPFVPTTVTVRREGFAARSQRVSSIFPGQAVDFNLARGREATNQVREFAPQASPIIVSSPGAPSVGPTIIAPITPPQAPAPVPTSDNNELLTFLLLQDQRGREDELRRRIDETESSLDFERAEREALEQQIETNRLEERRIREELRAASERDANTLREELEATRLEEAQARERAETLRRETREREERLRREAQELADAQALANQAQTRLSQIEAAAPRVPQRATRPEPRFQEGDYVVLTRSFAGRNVGTVLLITSTDYRERISAWFYQVETSEGARFSVIESDLSRAARQRFPEPSVQTITPFQPDIPLSPPPGPRGDTGLLEPEEFTRFDPDIPLSPPPGPRGEGIATPVQITPVQTTPVQTTPDEGNILPTREQAPPVSRDARPSARYDVGDYVLGNSPGGRGGSRTWLITDREYQELQTLQSRWLYTVQDSDGFSTTLVEGVLSPAPNQRF